MKRILSVILAGLIIIMIQGLTFADTPEDSQNPDEAVEAVLEENEDENIPVVGEDIEIGDGEFKIVSVEIDEKTTNPTPYYLGGGALILVILGFLLKRRING